jgi:hypothetical protein
VPTQIAAPTAAVTAEVSLRSRGMKPQRHRRQYSPKPSD